MNDKFKALITELGVDKAFQKGMPNLNGRIIVEPSEIDLHRIKLYAKKGELHKVPKEHQDWLCYRFLPSLLTYGCYPPPPEHTLSERALDLAAEAQKLCDNLRSGINN